MQRNHEQAARLTQKSKPKTRTILRQMVEAGLVEEHGQKKERVWHLPTAAYRVSGEKAACVHQYSFGPLLQEQMVLKYPEKHGHITRCEAAELRRITEP
ncbi:MAG: hypothetical protein ACUVSL_05320 [Chloroflexus sp.]|uniref:hypothetical protein n=1 Tax=Chloroflexus sp. TaxID=1904827 RepID=UPI00404B3E96